MVLVSSVWSCVYLCVCFLKHGHLIVTEPIENCCKQPKKNFEGRLGTKTTSRQIGVCVLIKATTWRAVYLTYRSSTGSAHVSHSGPRRRHVESCRRGANTIIVLLSSLPNLKISFRLMEWQCVDSKVRFQSHPSGGGGGAECWAVVVLLVGG